MVTSLTLLEGFGGQLTFCTSSLLSSRNAGLGAWLVSGLLRSDTCSLSTVNTESETAVVNVTYSNREQTRQ